MKDAVRFVGVAMEIDQKLTGFFEHEQGEKLSDDGKWIVDNHWIVDIRGETSDFLKGLGQMEKEGCTQKLIGLLKYARDHGAAWILFKE